MKALAVEGTGGIDSLRFSDYPEPSIVNPTDIIVRVRATTVNRLDVFRREGSHGAAPLQFPYIAGAEYAGDVVKVGSGVTRFKPGDRIFGPGSHTHAQYARVGPNAGGHQGEPELIPEGLSYEEAAAIPISFCMAWHSLHCDGNMRAGEDVLVMGASSGLGSSGIQLARSVGARVITTAGSDAKLEKARALGADEVINYQTLPAFSARVRELTGGRGVDLVFDHIGTPVWAECFASLKRRGRLVSCGVTAGHWVSLHLGQLWMRELKIIGSTNDQGTDFRTIADMTARRVIRPVVDSVFSLEEGAEAHQRLESRDFFGKVVLSVP